MRAMVDSVGTHVAALAAHAGIDALPAYRYAVTAWAMILRSGHYVIAHDHGDAHWSIAYYVDAGDDRPAPSGRIAFLDPRRSGRSIPELSLFGETFDLARDGNSVVSGILEAAARVRVGVGATPDGHHCDGPWVGAFDRLGGIAGPVAAELVEVAPKRGAVAGVVDQNGPNRAIGGGHPEHGERVIDGSAGIDAQQDSLVAGFTLDGQPLWRSHLARSFH